MMPDDKNQTVDGFSDNMTEQKIPTRGEQEGIPGSPDPGTHGAAEPMSPQEFAKMKKEAEQEDKDEEK